jgi:hypothetical protein
VTEQNSPALGNPDSGLPSKRRFSRLAIVACVVGPLLSVVPFLLIGGHRQHVLFYIVFYVILAVGLFTGPILGVFALQSIRKYQGQLRGRWLAHGAIWLSVTLFFTSCLLPAVTKELQSSKGIRCRVQLHQISEAIAAYQSIFAGVNPPRLETLTHADPNTPYHLPEDDLICPSSNNTPGQCSYVYRGDDLTRQSPGEMILLYDNAPRHEEEKRILVLFALGKIQYFSLEDLLPDANDNPFTRDNELRRQMGLPEKPDGLVFDRAKVQAERDKRLMRQKQRE